MKLTRILAFGFALGTLVVPGVPGAATLFSEDFESPSGLADGKWATVGSGYISAGGYNSTNCLKYSAKGSGGDGWTIFITGLSGSTTYYVGVDYKETGGGGFLGMNEYNNLGSDLGETWIFGDNSYATLAKFNTAGLAWNHYSQAITTKAATRKIKLKFEDFSGSSGVLGHTYFDNVTFSDTPPVVGVTTTIVQWREVAK